ncbi:MAG TPA: peptide deformylase [Candidatus Dormibacteraeota bacterium]
MRATRTRALVEPDGNRRALIREVLVHPHPMLKRVCEAAPPSLAAGVVHDLLDTMRAHPRCVGLAAPQIGEPIRIAVVDVRGHKLADSSNGLLVLVDAVIEAATGKHVAREGCLSLPSITADVRRARRIGIRSASALLWSEGFEARAVQHELDHLDGILILDRVESVHALFPRRVPH